MQCQKIQTTLLDRSQHHNRSLVRTTRFRAQQSVAARAQGAQADDETFSAPAKPTQLYSPVLRNIKRSRNEQILQRELFGNSADSAAKNGVPTLNDVRHARTVSELRSVINAADKHGCLDGVWIAACLTALPRLRQHRQNRVPVEVQSRDVQQLAQFLAQRAIQYLDNMDAQSLVGTAVALVKLKHQNDFLFRELARSSVAHMQTGAMSAQGLSNLVWALANAGVRPCGSWLSEFWMTLEDEVDKLSGQDIANVFWSICRLELMPPWVTGSMPRILEISLRRVGCTESGQDPATVMVCLAIWSRSYSYRPPDELLSQLLSSMQPYLQHYLPQDLVSIVHSLVIMNANPSRAWMTDFYLVLRDRLIFDPTLSYSDFQRLLWALSRIDYVPSQGWLRHFVEVSIVKLQCMRFRALSELVWALACWGYTPTAEWLSEYFRVTHAKLQDYKPQHLANSILALKKLGCKVPSVWLDAALVSFCAQVTDSRAHDLVTFIDGIVDVCEDAAWMSRPATGQRLRSLADYAASKFDICDCVMHAKLLIALATARCCPGVAWLRAQQDSLAKSLNAEEKGALDTATAGSVRAAYAAWDVPLSPSLEQELDSKTS